MNYKYYIADVFTNQVFNGAQVAVFPEAQGLTDEQMAKIAREINLSETVFLFKSQVESKWRMRAFSPYTELGEVGHPIIAAAFVLVLNDQIILTEINFSLVIEQKNSSTAVNITNNKGKVESIQYTQKNAPIVDFYAPTDGEMAKILSIDDGSIDSKKYSTRLVSCGYPYLIVPVFYYETVRQARFNFAVWSQSSAPQTTAQEILLVSPKTPSQDSDFAVRLLGPNIGPHQDPPIGSAMASFASYLCSFDHMRKGTYTFAVERGDEKVRRSVINLEMDHKGEDTLTIRVGGEAVMVAEGAMVVPN